MFLEMPVTEPLMSCFSSHTCNVNSDSRTLMKSGLWILKEIIFSLRNYLRGLER
ncbi:rCG45709 [Rattus norvegicus]|uniref:RCG45709 n=1 Tax=Rattus norvegicus TaxID=10116 RepID=A6JUG3_RAT|nr:rCG45709 [Rattus norvegicus]